MFYKVIHNNMLVDLLTDVQWIRYLPRQKRVVMTDRQSANGVMGSDHNTLYHLEGRPYTFDTEIKSVQIMQISEDEFDRLSTEFAIVQQDNASLRAEIGALKQQLTVQNYMLSQILAKLS